MFHFYWGLCFGTTKRSTILTSVLSLNPSSKWYWDLDFWTGIHREGTLHLWAGSVLAPPPPACLHLLSSCHSFGTYRSASCRFQWHNKFDVLKRWVVFLVSKHEVFFDGNHCGDTVYCSNADLLLQRSFDTNYNSFVGLKILHLCRWTMQIPLILRKT